LKGALKQVRRVITLLYYALESPGSISNITILGSRLILVYKVITKVKQRAKVYRLLRAGVTLIPSKVRFVLISC
jgi:hypothetical protein